MAYIFARMRTNQNITIFCLYEVCHRELRPNENCFNISEIAYVNSSEHRPLYTYTYYCAVTVRPLSVTVLTLCVMTRPQCIIAPPDCAVTVRPLSMTVLTLSMTVLTLRMMTRPQCIIAPPDCAVTVPCFCPAERGPVRGNRSDAGHSAGGQLSGAARQSAPGPDGGRADLPAALEGAHRVRTQHGPREAGS